MSPLTKVFVILLVLLSLVLTAGTIVFVNQVEDYKGDANAATAKLTAARADLDRQRDETAAASASAQESARQAATQLETAKQKINELQQAMVAKDTELAQQKSQNAIQSIDVTKLTGALQGSEATKSRLQEQVTELRGSNDKYASQNAELNQTVTDLTNRLDVTERERKLLAEQNAELKSQNDKQASALKDLGYSPAQLASTNRLGAPPISGVIRDVRTISGVPYAAISVGSADNVTRGMEFKVVNRDTGAFLGVLTVDTVEQNEATGRLSGPRIADIKPGAEVKTQL